MKKTLSIILVTVLLFGLATVVRASAASDQIVDELVAELETNMKDAGITLTVTDAQKVELKRIASNLISNDKDAITAKIDELTQYMEDNKITNGTELTAKQMQDILAIANDVAEIVGVKISYDANSDSINVYDSTNKLLLTLSAASDALVQTGGYNYAVVLVPGVAIIAIAAFIGIRKFNNK